MAPAVKLMDQEDRDRIVQEAERALEDGQFELSEYPSGAALVAQLVAGAVPGDRFRWLGNAAVYDVEDEWPVLYLTSPARNPLLQRPVEAALALAENSLLPLADAEELHAIKADPDTVRVLLVELDLKVEVDCCWPTTPRAEREGPKNNRYDARHPHFHIETDGGVSRLNPAQRRLADALLGEPLDRYLYWLRRRDIHQTKVMTMWQGNVVARHQQFGPFALGARLSEVRGHWEVDGNVLLSCDGVLGRAQELRVSRPPPPPGQMGR